MFGILDTTEAPMHTRSAMSEGREGAKQSAVTDEKPSEVPRRCYEAPRIERRIPVVRNTLGQPPGPGGASGTESVFP